MANENNRVARLKDRLQKERQARLKEREQLKATLTKVKELEKRPTQEHIDKRVGELQGKVRSRAWRDAANEVAKELKIKPEHVADFFDLAKLSMDKDEPDQKAIKESFKALVEKRQWPIQPEETET